VRYGLRTLLSKERTMLLGILAALALLLSADRQLRRDFLQRRAAHARSRHPRLLGASHDMLLRLVRGNKMTLAAIGLALGFAGSIGVTRRSRACCLASARAIR
jgi:hypothetical protein